MVIDKTGILNLLRETEEELKLHQGEDSILITTSCNDFSHTQIGNDSIDLRIDKTGYVISNDYKYINTLSDEDFSKYFRKVSLDPMKGYNLKPGDILFIGTLERIHLVGDLIGRVTGRSVFSRFGLSVHCTQEKFSSGINSIAALQIKNNTNTILKIFPYQKLAQLIIEKTSHNEHPYVGTFSLESEYKIPVVKESDRDHYDKRTLEYIKRLTPQKKSILEKHSSSPKLNSLVQSIFGFLISVGFGVFGFMGEKSWAIGIMIFLSIIYILMSWFFYKNSIKDDGDENT